MVEASIQRRQGLGLPYLSFLARVFFVFLPSGVNKSPWWIWGAFREFNYKLRMIYIYIYYVLMWCSTYIEIYLYTHEYVCLYIYIYVISSRFRTSSQPPGHGFCGDRPRDPGILLHFEGVQRWSYNDSDGGKHAIPKYFSQGRCHVPFAWKNNNGCRYWYIPRIISSRYL